MKCLALVLAGMLCAALPSSQCYGKIPAESAGAVVECFRLGRKVAGMEADIYLPANAPPSALVVVVHGFSRNKSHMAGWGRLLARHGFMAMVPTLPHRTDHQKNAEALVALIQKVRMGKIDPSLPGTQKVGLIGFSMGGLITLMTGPDVQPDVWVGLDVAGRGSLGVEAAKQMHCPAFLFEADEDRFGLRASRRQLIENYAGPIEVFRPAGSTHCDAESDTDMLGELAFGKSCSVRRAEIQRRVMDFLHKTLGW